MGKIVLADMVEKLQLETVFSSDKKEVDLPNSNFNRPGLQLAGFYEHYASQRAQIMGQAEISYIEYMLEEEREKGVDAYFAHGMPFIIVTRELEVPDCVLNGARKYNVPLYRSSLPTTQLIQEMMAYIDNQLLPSITLHGVMMDIFGQGVLILGQSGIGKSETALELIERGNRLVADDGVRIQRVKGKSLMARSPELIKYFMEIRGVGVIDVKAMFGIGSVLDEKQIDIVAKMELWDESKTYERLGMSREYHNILGVDVPCITLPVRPGRNMAAVVEAAARNERLKKMGYHSAFELNNRVIKANSK